MQTTISLRSYEKKYYIAPGISARTMGDGFENAE
jgi:hypothetical protein